MFLFSSWIMVFITLGQSWMIPDGFVCKIKNKNSFSIKQYTVAKLNFGFLSLKMTLFGLLACYIVYVFIF